MSKAKSLAKNTIILASGKLSAQLVTFLLLPLYTYYLSPAEYGFADLITVYITLLVPTLTLQMEMASFRYLVDARKSEADRARIISSIVHMTIALVLPWIILFAAIGIVTNFIYTWIVLLTAIAVLASNVSQQIARGLGDNKRFAIASLLIGVVTLLGALLFIVNMGMRVEGMLLSIAAANVVATLYLVMSMRLYRYVQQNSIDRKLQREILGYSVPLVPNGIAWWVINASDRAIISILINTAANGIYAVATKYAAILTSLFGIFGMSWTESASIHIDAPDRDKFFSRVANAAVRMFGALGLGLIATVPFVFPFMVDVEFREAYLYVPIMVIGVFFNVVVGIYSAIYVAKRLTKQVMNTSLVAAALNIVLTIGLIPFFGLYAAAAATAVAFLAMAVYRHYDVKKYVQITYDKNIFIVLAALYAAVMCFYYLDILWASIAGVVLATAAAYWLNRNELGQIAAMMKRRS